MNAQEFIKAVNAEKYVIDGEEHIRMYVRVKEEQKNYLMRYCKEHKAEILAELDRQEKFHEDSTAESREEKLKKAREDKYKQIVALYQQGMTQNQIAKQTGCTLTVVSKVLQVQKDSKESRAKRNIKIIQLYYQGLTEKEIAEQAGCSDSTVKKVISRYKEIIESLSAY